MGPLPVTSGSFTTADGTLLITFSGSGFSNSVAGLIGMNIAIDGVISGHISEIYANNTLTHMAIILKTWVRTGLAAGPHIITLSTVPGTVTDFNDRFNVSVTEFPF